MHGSHGDKDCLTHAAGRGPEGAWQSAAEFQWNPVIRIRKPRLVWHKNTHRGRSKRQKKKKSTHDRIPAVSLISPSIPPLWRLAGVLIMSAGKGTFVMGRAHKQEISPDLLFWTHAAFHQRWEERTLWSFLYGLNQMLWVCAQSLLTTSFIPFSCRVFYASSVWLRWLGVYLAERIRGEEMVCLSSGSDAAHNYAHVTPLETKSMCFLVFCVSWCVCM